MDQSKRMPVMFIGHGSPMNAIEENEFSLGWRDAAKQIQTPEAILCISAHWETWGTGVTAMENPRTIHDFGGFPKELFEAQYPAPGSPKLAAKVADMITSAHVQMDLDWGLDHGTWSVLKQMYPRADIPVVQLSLDYTKSAKAHYELAKELSPLRDQGILILGSGNIVHNLRRIVFRGSISDFNQPFALPWAHEANDLIHMLIQENRYEELADYQALGPAVQLAIPTPEHYLPFLYAIALKDEADNITFFNDKPVAGSLTMTCLKIS